MARDIATIQQDIDASRERLRTTAEAIGFKADVPARARDLMREARAVIGSRNGGADGAGQGGPDVGARLHGMRERIGQVADAATQRVTAAAESAQGAVAGVAQSAEGRAGDAAGSATDMAASVAHQLPSRAEVAAGSRRVARMAAANPVPVAFAGLLAGMGAALLLPSTRVERERIGPVADDIAERGAAVGAEAVGAVGERLREAVPT